MFQSLKDLLFFPVRIIFRHEIIEKLGLTSLRDERINSVLRYCNGRVIDIGCGEGNRLIKRYKLSGRDGLGIDVFPWSGVDKVCDTTHMLFEDKSFDTVTLVGVINHIPAAIRKTVLKECHRILSDNGIIILTNLSPWVGLLRHKLAWWDEDQRKRGMKEGEEYGLCPRSVRNIIAEAGFRGIFRKRFAYGLNSLFVARKK